MSYEIKQKNPSSIIFRVNKLKPDKKMGFVFERDFFLKYSFLELCCLENKFFQKLHFLEEKIRYFGLFPNPEIHLVSNVVWLSCQIL